MKGVISPEGRALLALSISSPSQQTPTEISVWIDTAFDGELVMSRSTINQLGLKASSAVEATMADGSKVVLTTYECLVHWFGELRAVEVIANEGRLPLLGIGLLKQRRLVLDYQASDLFLD